jgi:hypothetical protein
MAVTKPTIPIGKQTRACKRFPALVSPNALFLGRLSSSASHLRYGNHRLGVPLPFADICPYRIYANSGCLASYGIDLADQFRRAATYAERNLKGTSRQVFRCSHQPSSNSSSI